MKRVISLVAVLLIVAACSTSGSSPGASATAASAPAASVPPASAAASAGGARPAGVPAKGESALIDGIYDRGVIKGCAAVAMPIIGVSTKSNQVYGLGVDFLNDLATRLGVKAEAVASEWDGLLPGVQTGKCDIIIAGLGLSPQRAEVVDYVLTSIKAGTCFICRKDKSRFNTWEEALAAAGVTVCGLTGTGFSQMMKTEHPNVKFYDMPGAGAAGLAQEVIAGRCDITNYDNWVIQYVLEQFQQLRVIPEDCIKSPLETYDWGFAILKGDAPALAYIKGVESELESNGKIDEWFEHYSSKEQMEEIVRLIDAKDTDRRRLGAGRWTASAA